MIRGLPQIRGTFFGGPCNRDYSSVGSILRCPCFGKFHIWGYLGFRGVGFRVGAGQGIGGTWRVGKSF